jgi:RimJ/RimL family protein N-acetyltransferase
VNAPPSPPIPETLQCGVCTLRAWRADDLESLVLHANDESVSRGLRDRFPYPYTDDDGRRWLESACGAGETSFAIDIDGAAVGGIGLRPGEDVYRHSAELGYWLGRAYWNRGIMTAAVSRLVAQAMVAPGLHRVFAHAHANNPASIRVLEKCGFVREGILRDAVLKRGMLIDAVVLARVRDGGA